MPEAFSFHGARLGVFDSGIGGLTVVKELLQTGSFSKIHYFGDTARVPYGGKSAATIQRYSLEIAKFLLTKKIDALVVACNTASALALFELQAALALPVYGMIDPIASLVKGNFWNKVAVIGTKGTISSSAYRRCLLKHSPHLEVVEVATPLFVPYIEEGLHNSPSFRLLLEESLYGIKKIERLDALFLGCTHYPLIQEELRDYFPNEIAIVDSSKALVGQLLPKSIKKNACDWSICSCYVSDDPKKFSFLADTMLGARGMSVEHVMF